jgi:hypothetical protein
VIGVWTGIFTLTVTYVIYLLHLLPSHVPMAMIPKMWGHGVNEYLEATNSPHGWGWVFLLGNWGFSQLSRFRPAGA